MPLDDSNIVSYYKSSQEPYRYFKFIDYKVSIWSSDLNGAYSRFNLTLDDSPKYSNINAYSVVYSLNGTIKVIERWEGKVKSNTLSTEYLPIISDIPLKAGVKSYLKQKGKYQVINVLDIEEKDSFHNYAILTFEEFFNLRQEWLNCCKKLSDYQEEYLEWKKSQPKIFKKNTVKQRKFEGSIKFDTGRFHKHTRDCVFDAGYKTIADIKKEKTLYVYSADKNELVNNWNLISHLNIVPVVLNTKEIPYIQDLSNMVNVKDFRAGKKRNSRKVVTAWWIQKEISKDRTLSEIYNAYLENIPNNLTNRILLIKEYMRKYFNGYLNDSLAEGLYQDYKEKGLLDVGIISEFNVLKAKVKYYRGYELIYTKTNKQESHKLLREIYILRKKTEMQSRLLKQIKVCKQQA